MFRRKRRDEKAVRQAAREERPTLAHVLSPITEKSTAVAFGSLDDGDSIPSFEDDDEDVEIDTLKLSHVGNETLPTMNSTQDSSATLGTLSSSSTLTSGLDTTTVTTTTTTKQEFQQMNSQARLCSILQSKKKAAPKTSSPKTPTAEYSLFCDSAAGLCFPAQQQHQKGSSSAALNRGAKPSMPKNIPFRNKGLLKKINSDANSLFTDLISTDEQDEDRTMWPIDEDVTQYLSSDESGTLFTNLETPVNEGPCGSHIGKLMERFAEWTTNNDDDDDDDDDNDEEEYEENLTFDDGTMMTFTSSVNGTEIQSSFSSVEDYSVDPSHMATDGMEHATNVPPAASWVTADTKVTSSTHRRLKKMLRRFNLER
jgi:hypothetical protein